MKSGALSILIFTIVGPIIGLLILFRGSLEALVFPFTLMAAFMMGGPVAALTGVIFVIFQAITARLSSLTYIWWGMGAILGGAAGITAAIASKLLLSDFNNASNIYWFCGVVGAICGAVRYALPTDH
jgi:hypothetical protein